jgi:hypothetical protein
MAAEPAPSPAKDEEMPEQICTTLTYKGRQLRVGEFVAILDGEVIASGDSFEEVDNALLDRGIEHGRGLVFQAAPPEPDIILIRRRRGVPPNRWRRA